MALRHLRLSIKSSPGPGVLSWKAKGDVPRHLLVKILQLIFAVEPRWSPLPGRTAKGGFPIEWTRPDDFTSKRLIAEGYA